MSFKQILSTRGVKPVLFTQFLASLGFGVILPILPFYATSLGAKPFELGMLTATFAFMSLVFGPLLGKLADRVGRKKILLLGALGFVVSYMLFAFSDSLEMAFAARAIGGVAAAGIFPACISLLSDFTSEEQRGKVMGLAGVSFSLGFIIGPAFGGLASAVSVQAAFLLSALFAGANFASVLMQVREPAEKRASRDLPSQELSLLHHLSSPLLFLFLASFMITFMIGGLDATLALYTSEKLGFTSAQVGGLFTYIGALILVMQFASSALVNKFGEVRLIQAGLLISGLGFVFLVFTGDWLSLLAPLAVFVTGNALVFPSVSSLVTKKVRGKRGAVLGLMSSFQSAGQMLGPLLGGFLYGINHSYAFLGLAACIGAYFIVFSLAGARKLAPPQ